MRKSVLALALLLAASAADALEVKQVTWGFDGLVVPEAFNLVSVLLDNPDPKPFDGTLRLSKVDGLGQPLNGELVAPCFVSPFARRWVQFSVFVIRQEEDWALSWGSKADERITLSATRLGPPACVYLDNAGEFLTGAASFKSFPDELFPTTVAALKGLHAVILDHAPSWEPVRRQAFMEWLAAGGTAHLAPDAYDKFPAFIEEMAPLNNPGPKTRIGAGLVVRHGVRRDRISDEYLKAQGYALPTLELNSSMSALSLVHFIFRRMQGLTQPKHNWAVIYLMICLYLGLIGPVNYIVGRVARTYRTTIGFFLIVVALFAAFFFVIGRRGYGESARVQTFAYARPVGPNRWNVAQWTNAFVVTGGYYTVRHSADHSMYSFCSDYETVNGVARNGRQAQLQVDIPLYSAQSFRHNAVFPGPDLAIRVTDWTGDKNLESFAMTGRFPEGTKAAWLVVNDRCYRMSRDKDEFRCAVGNAEMVDVAAALNIRPEWERASEEERSKDLPVLCMEVAEATITETLGMPHAAGQMVTVQHAPRTGADVFILAPQPDAWDMAKSGLGVEAGYVLYHLTFFKQEP